MRPRKSITGITRLCNMFSRYLNRIVLDSPDRNCKHSSPVFSKTRAVRAASGNVISRNTCAVCRQVERDFATDAGLLRRCVDPRSCNVPVDSERSEI